MRISLCVICGNEAEHIAAMLDSFAPMFDELSLVRAIGCKKPDETADMARNWCQLNGKDFIFSEHANQLGAEDWDHVDSFAMARNAAFAQASGEWLVWADCDDVMPDATGFREILASAAPDTLLLRFPYDVRGSNKKLLRERAIRRTAFQAGRKWHHDVHENLLLHAGDGHVDLSFPVWVHAPKSVKVDNRKRNLRILGQSLKEAATSYFYVHQEHYCMNSFRAAEEFGKIALSFPNLPPAFRYEALLNCARVTSDRKQALAYALEAHSVYPWCREALAALILLQFERKDARKAAFWADKMLELPEPPESDRPWTHEAKFYGWAGLDLAARAHRLNGGAGRATMLQFEYHGGKSPRITLVHATRGRATKAIGCRDSWLNAASKPAQVEHIFAVDADDAESVGMAKQFLHVVSSQKSCVAAWNLAAQAARGDLIVQLSDDWAPVLGWDEKLLAVVAGRDLQREQVVVAVSDGTRTDDLLCMAILSRGRLDAQGGEMFSPEYESVFSDNEFSHRAWGDGVVVDARASITFEHLHPAFGKGALDATYQHNNQAERYRRGEETFKRRNPA